MWRIIGVFSVEDEDGNWDTRIKLVRNESIGYNYWNTTNVNGYHGVIPVVYLKPNIKIISGDGSEYKPYQLEL